MTATPTSKGKDRTVSPGSEPDSASDAAQLEVTSGGGAVKKTSVAGQQHDETFVQVPSVDDDAETTREVKVAGRDAAAPATSATLSNETVTDLSAVAGEQPAKKAPADPPWAAATEPPGSVFAGRKASPSRGFSPPPEPVRPFEMPVPSAANPNVVRGPRPTDGKSPRRAHLQVSRFEPLSVMRFSFVMSLVCFVVLMVAVTVLYVILSGLGVFDSISSTINELTQEQGSKTGGFDAASWFSFTKIFGYTALIGGLNVLIITALATVWSVIYNIAADFVGGVEVTLKEAE